MGRKGERAARNNSCPFPLCDQWEVVSTKLQIFRKIVCSSRLSLYHAFFSLSWFYIRNVTLHLSWLYIVCSLYIWTHGWVVCLSVCLFIQLFSVSSDCLPVNLWCISFFTFLKCSFNSLLSFLACVTFPACLSHFYLIQDLVSSDSSCFVPFVSIIVFMQSVSLTLHTCSLYSDLTILIIIPASRVFPNCRVRSATIRTAYWKDASEQKMSSLPLSLLRL